MGLSLCGKPASSGSTTGVDELRILIDRSRAGDLTAFEDLVRRFQGTLLEYAYSVLSDSHWAEDAVQEAFIEAFQKLPQLRNSEAFSGWLRKIVLKHCDRLTRGQRIRPVCLENATEIATEHARPDQVAERRDLQVRVLAAIRALPEHKRTATTLYYIDDYSQKEIADLLRVPLTTVQKRLHDSRKELKERWLRAAGLQPDSYRPAERPARRTILASGPAATRSAGGTAGMIQKEHIDVTDQACQRSDNVAGKYLVFRLADSECVPGERPERVIHQE